MHRLSLERIEEAARLIDPCFRNSPQFESAGLNERLGLRLVLKVETLNPLRSFKGRGADYFMQTLRPDLHRLVCASAGNFGQALPYAAARRGIRVDVFAAETANPVKIEAMRRCGARLHLQGADFDTAKAHARAYAAGNGWPFIEDGREPAISEGAGTIAVEMESYPDPVDAVLVPLGNGALLGGIARWIKARRPATRVIGVCAEGAPSMERSWREQRVVELPSVDTIADGIAVRVPIPEALDDLREAVDDIWLVPDAATVEAMRLVFDATSLMLEPAGAVGVAAAMLRRADLRGQVVATVLCGANVTPQQAGCWLTLPAPPSRGIW
jgi:threonine dehydratase